MSIKDITGFQKTLGNAGAIASMSGRVIAMTMLLLSHFLKA
jgi:hypothetical protein